MSDVRETLHALAVRELDWTGALPDGSLAEHLDSLQLMSLVVAVEDRFRIVLEPSDEAQIDTLDDLVATIERKRDA